MSVKARIIVALSVICSVNVSKGKMLAEWDRKPPSVWKVFERLVEEQKYAEAEKWIQKRLEQVKDEPVEATRCLVRLAQVRITLHGYEKALKGLFEAEWPKDPVSEAILNLYYAHTLQTYAEAYEWELRRREPMIGESRSIKDWSYDQIQAEARLAYAKAYGARELLGTIPVKALEEYIKPNTYPEGIRPTVRDAVTYLFAEALANIRAWSAQEFADVWKLDVMGLLAEAQAVESLDISRHPLELAASILGELEAWHQSRGEAEAALEAWLQRARILHESLQDEMAMIKVREALEKRLENCRHLSWWAMGMADLASFYRAEAGPNALEDAHRVATRCLSAMPNTPGGQRCKAIAADIEMPDYSLKAMASDAPGKRSIAIEYKNLSRLYFRAFRLDISSDEKILELIRPDAAEQVCAGQAPDYEWNVELEPTKDFRMHRAFVVPPFREPGVYFILASARSDFSRGNNALRGVHMVISDLVILKRQEGRGLLVRVLNGSTGMATPGAKVKLFRSHTVTTDIAEKTTDNRGEVFFENESRAVLLVAQLGQAITIDFAPTYMFSPSTERHQRGVLIYTDRSVYRPLQTIRFKVVAFEKERGQLRPVCEHDLQVRLLDASGQEVDGVSLRTNKFGTAAGEFRIPGGRLLGAWRLVSEAGWFTTVLVEEYKRPTFEVEILEPKEPLRLKSPAVLRGKAQYYFGLPVSWGKARYRITRSVETFRGLEWPFFRPRPRDVVVASGVAPLGPNGEFEIRFTPEAEEGGGDSQFCTFKLTVEVTDEGGETRSASRSFEIGVVAVNAYIEADTGLFREGAEARLRIKRTDSDGKPLRGRGLLKVMALKGPKKALLPADLPVPAPPRGFFYTEGDLQRPRWDTNYNPFSVLEQWEEGEELYKREVEHGDDGVGNVVLSGLIAGAYRLYYETHDRFGEKFSTKRDILVVGPGLKIALPFLFLIERDTVRVGESFVAFIYSGIQGMPITLEIYQDYKRVMIWEGVSGMVEIPITDDLRGGFVVSAYAVQDFQLMNVSRKVHVPWDNKELKISFETFRDKLRPGSREKFIIKISGRAEKEAALAGAEVLAYMYDRSLDLFEPHTPPSILALYPTRSYAAEIRSNVDSVSQIWLGRTGFRKGAFWEGFEADALQFYDSYGVGGPGWRRPHVFKKAAVRERVAEAPSPGDKAQAPIEPRAKELRTDFSETAFFLPHLLSGPDGTVSIEFTVPDSVTGWNLWVHALTEDLRAGSLLKQAQSIKELMVRPYLPRFLREGDEAEIRVVVNNASDSPLKGTVMLQVLDPENEADLSEAFRLEPRAREFEVDAKQGTSVSFTLKAPSNAKTVLFKAVATSENLSDGEIRPLLVLPGRMHLMQSKFQVLKGRDRKILNIEELARSAQDPTLVHEQLVITLDAQLFYSMLSALPYLANYPYECTEQTMNRFLAAGIMASLFEHFPELAALGREFAKRKTRFEPFDAADPNRKMALEETPWVLEAQGGDDAETIALLDPDVAKAQRADAIEKLRKAQAPSGGFPWFPGGPPSPYMTLYLLYGFSKALEFGVEVPNDIVTKAWEYMKSYYLEECLKEQMLTSTGHEFITFLNFVLSQYPKDSTAGLFSEQDRKKMVDYSFKHWKQHSPYLKGMLALTLWRLGRRKEARLVWASVMDSAKTTPDQGTFWAPEDKSWLWYNDTIETHAFALRVLLEIAPEHEKLDGIVLWLFLNKKLNHWKSTRATAEVIYSVASYLKRKGELWRREVAKVSVGQDVRHFVFDPGVYTGKKNQIVYAGPEIRPEHSKITVEKSGEGFMFASATWHFSTEKAPERATGDLLSITRSYYIRDKFTGETVLRPLREGDAVHVGDEIEVHLAIKAKHALEFVHVRDPRPAGFEPVALKSGYKWATGIGYYEEIRDSGENFFIDWLPHGEYVLKYRLQAAHKGVFRVAPATIQPMYAPEFSAHSAASVMTVGELR